MRIESPRGDGNSLMPTVVLERSLFWVMRIESPRGDGNGLAGLSSRPEEFRNEN